jgi:hypothetical protein
LGARRPVDYCDGHDDEMLAAVMIC